MGIINDVEKFVKLFQNLRISLENQELGRCLGIFSCLTWPGFFVSLTDPRTQEEVMARVHEIKPEIDIRDDAERVINIKLTQDQVEDAIMIWLRLKGVTVPSQHIKDYTINYNLSNYCSERMNSNVVLIHSQKL